MNLTEAQANMLGEEGAITRPQLLAERGVYLTYEGPDRPLKQHWLGRPGLTIDWTPAGRDLAADDWMIVSKVWAELNAAPNDA